METGLQFAHQRLEIRIGSVNNLLAEFANAVFKAAGRHKRKACYGGFAKKIGEIGYVRALLWRAGSGVGRVFRLVYVVFGWRRVRDSNPRYPLRYAGFQDRCHQPLGQLSALNILQQGRRAAGFWGAMRRGSGVRRVAGAILRDIMRCVRIPPRNDEL